ncbi:MAG: hypothetical protein E5V71_03080 [Mesorhizobium sp.]|nr:MAG: hypothetical protein E5V71_03080 [Mesorhizobium sp.]
MRTFDPLSYATRMRHSSLSSFLNGATSAKELWQEINAEVNECVAATAKRGGIGHVIITDGPSMRVKWHHVDKLLGELADEKLPLSAASYIADALIMSDDFHWDDEAVAEALFFLSDESAPQTLAEIEAARSRFSTAR